MAAQRARDVSARAHRHAFTTWYGSVAELAAVAGVLYEQLKTPEPWVHSYEHDTEKPDPLLFHHACRELAVAPAETLMVGDHPTKDGGAAGAGLRAYVLPAAAAPGAHRGLDAVLRLAGRDCVPDIRE
ncbi:HAD-IA family hydrolase [Streptomyces lydicus]|uniref:HAD-IA family hydrolase n=1 Tax=Streptomyces lydicus TaxID=47763 RepID=UPI0033FD4989